MIELLCEEVLAPDRVARALRTARAVGDAESQGAKDREERLRSLGLSSPTRPLAASDSH